MLVSKENILKYIPQRPPFVMVDNLIECGSSKFITNFKILESNLFVFKNSISESALIENIAQTCAVGFGFGTHRLRGVLSGKYALSRKIELAGQEEGQFEIELYLDEIPRMKESFPESSVGQELGWMWVQTGREDVGLEGTRVELISKQE